MTDKLLIKLMKRRIRRSWGADCETKDIDDYPELKKVPPMSGARCDSCFAKEVTEWLEDWELLLK